VSSADPHGDEDSDLEDVSPAAVIQRRIDAARRTMDLRNSSEKTGKRDVQAMPRGAGRKRRGNCSHFARVKSSRPSGLFSALYASYTFQPALVSHESTTLLSVPTAVFTSDRVPSACPRVPYSSQDGRRRAYRPRPCAISLPHLRSSRGRHGRAHQWRPRTVSLLSCLMYPRSPWGRRCRAHRRRLHAISLHLASTPRESSPGSVGGR